MRRRGLWLAAAVVIVANLAAWGAAARNRRGEAEAVLVLTERELRLPVKQAENTALALSIVFEPPRPRAAGGPRDAGWFDRAKLEAIGFDCARPATPEHAAYYRTRPPRSTFAALAYEGETWRAEVERRERSQPDAAADASRDPLLDSHLAVIDVDNSPAALRARHPDRRRVAIMEATAILLYVSRPGQAPFLAGRVTSVLPSDIDVPREWRGSLTAMQPERDDAARPPVREPRYRVTVGWGTRLEPRITSVELLKPEAAR